MSMIGRTIQVRHPKRSGTLNCVVMDKVARERYQGSQHDVYVVRYNEEGEENKAPYHTMLVDPDNILFVLTL